jgi:hypothetical protein
MDRVVHEDMVNAILPGGFMAESNRHWSEVHPGVFEQCRANSPLGRLAGRSRVTRGGPWQATPRDITCAALVIDGGGMR